MIGLKSYTPKKSGILWWKDSTRQIWQRRNLYGEEEKENGVSILRNAYR